MIFPIVIGVVWLAGIVASSAYLVCNEGYLDEDMILTVMFWPPFVAVGCIMFIIYSPVWLGKQLGESCAKRKKVDKA